MMGDVNEIEVVVAHQVNRQSSLCDEFGGAQSSK
jgi:hypothetical protein